MKMIAVTMPGQTSGSVTVRSVFRRPAPSSAAASSISFGTEAKKECIIHTAKDRLNAALTRIMASQVSLMPQRQELAEEPGREHRRLQHLGDQHEQQEDRLARELLARGVVGGRQRDDEHQEGRRRAR